MAKEVFFASKYIKLLLMDRISCPFIFTNEMETKQKILKSAKEISEFKYKGEIKSIEGNEDNDKFLVVTKN